MRRRDFIALLGSSMMAVEALARLPLLTWTVFALLTYN
jgi:hypothetical protein